MIRREFISLLGGAAASRRLCRQDSARSETGRYPSRAADQVRADYPPDDGEGARPHHSAVAARPRRRGDRMIGAMRRRSFITLLGGAATWPLAARAQQPAKPPTIGFLGQSTPSAESQRMVAFVQRLRELGWIEGQNIAIEVRWGEGRNERFAEIAAEFVRLKVDVIVTSGTANVLAAKEATVVRQHLSDRMS